MRNSGRAVIAASLAAALAAGCATQQPRYQQPRYQQPAPAVPGAAYVQYGQVVNVESIRGDGHTVGRGAILGGVVGAVLGHQVGAGSGKDAATVAGIVGGALIGNEIEKRQQVTSDLTRVTVRFDNGGQRSFDDAQGVDVRVGDRVRVEGDRVVRY